MSDIFNSQSDNCFKEAVCIDAQRIYDSCGDKDCIEDLSVRFSPDSQQIIDNATNIRIRDVDIITVYINLEPVPFHKGFYSVDMTFFFDICFDVFTSPASVPCMVNGLAIFNKKVVLYGSEGDVKIFTSDYTQDESDTQCSPTKNLPRAIVQVAEPVALSAKIKEKKKCCCQCCRIPENIIRRYGSLSDDSMGENEVAVTIGLFTIVQIERNVQILIPAYDFCIPEKECVTTADNPCEMFSRIDFPINEFFPPNATDISDDNRPSCCCKHKSKCSE